MLKRLWQLQIGIEMERDGCSTKHNENLQSLNGPSTAEGSHTDERDLSEWLKSVWLAQ